MMLEKSVGGQLAYRRKTDLIERILYRKNGTMDYLANLFYCLAVGGDMQGRDLVK